MTRLTAALGVALLTLAPTLAVPLSSPAHAEGPAGLEAQCGGLPATLVGTAGDDDLDGTPGADVIVGLDGNDAIRGLDGDDVLCGGPGADTLVGGAGNDKLLGGQLASVLRGGEGDDKIVGVLALDADTQSVTGGSGRHDRYVLRFVTQGVGTIDGTTGRVDLRHELARSTDGFDTATMPVRGIEEVKVLTRGHWTLIGGPLGEVLLGHSRRGAPVTIHAGGGRDLLRGTRNHDLLDGGKGVDTVQPTRGDDTCWSIERVVRAFSC